MRMAFPTLDTRFTLARRNLRDVHVPAHCRFERHFIVLTIAVSNCSSSWEAETQKTIEIPLDHWIIEEISPTRLLPAQSVREFRNALRSRELRDPGL